MTGCLGSKPGKDVLNFLARWSFLLGHRGVAEVAHGWADVYRQTVGGFEHVVLNWDGGVWRQQESTSISGDAYLQGLRKFLRTSHVDFVVYNDRGKLDIEQARQADKDERSGAAKARRQEDARRLRVNEICQEHQTPKMVKGMVEILLGQGEREERQAELIGGWAVIREESHRGPRWNLTHRQSGTFLARFPQRKLARQCASILAQAKWAEERIPTTDHERRILLLAMKLLGFADCLSYTGSQVAKELTGWPELIFGPDPAASVE